MGPGAGLVLGRQVSLSLTEWSKEQGAGNEKEGRRAGRREKGEYNRE